MMTIDEAIIHTREKEEDNRKYAQECEECANRKLDKLMGLDKVHQRDMQSCIKCADEHEQLAEWLEELKSLRNASELWEHNNNLAYKQGRVDAIDDFMKNMEEWDKRVGFIRDECAFFTISNIRDMAEQIKSK